MRVKYAITIKTRHLSKPQDVENDNKNKLANYKYANYDALMHVIRPLDIYVYRETQFSSVRNVRTIRIESDKI